MTENVQDRIDWKILDKLKAARFPLERHIIERLTIIDYKWAFHAVVNMDSVQLVIHECKDIIIVTVEEIIANESTLLVPTDRQLDSWCVTSRV
jgi:hypothetical protein